MDRFILSILQVLILRALAFQGLARHGKTRGASDFITGDFHGWDFFGQVNPLIRVIFLVKAGSGVRRDQTTETYVPAMVCGVCPGAGQKKLAGLIPYAFPALLRCRKVFCASVGVGLLWMMNDGIVIKEGAVANLSHRTGNLLIS